MNKVCKALLLSIVFLSSQAHAGIFDTLSDFVSTLYNACAANPKKTAFGIGAVASGITYFTIRDEMFAKYQNIKNALAGSAPENSWRQFEIDEYRGLPLDIIGAIEKYNLEVKDYIKTKQNDSSATIESIKPCKDAIIQLIDKHRAMPRRITNFILSALACGLMGVGIQQLYTYYYQK